MPIEGEVVEAEDDYDDDQVDDDDEHDDHHGTQMKYQTEGLRNREFPRRHGPLHRHALNVIQQRHIFHVNHKPLQYQQQ